MARKGFIGLAGGGAGTGVTGSSLTSGNVIQGAGSSAVSDSGVAVSSLATNANRIDQNNAATTSAQLATVISDETGTGKLTFATTPTLITPVLGVATATSINKMAITAPATSSTLAVADGKTLTASNTLTLAGTDGDTLTVPSGGGTAAVTANKLSAFAATTSAELAGVISDETGSSLLVFNTTPTLVTPVLGVATATSINKVALTAPASAATLTIANNKTLTCNNTLTLAGTDAQTMTFPAVSDTVAGLGTIQTFTAQQYNTGSRVFMSANQTLPAASTNLEAITELIFTLPATTARNFWFHAMGLYNQNTAGSASTGIGIQFGVAPTNAWVSGRFQLGSASFTGSAPSVITSTTATTISAGTVTSTATFAWEMHGFVESSATGTQTIQIMGKTGTQADTLTFYRGSYLEVG